MRIKISALRRPKTLGTERCSSSTVSTKFRKC